MSIFDSVMNVRAQALRRLELEAQKTANQVKALSNGGNLVSAESLATASSASTSGTSQINNELRNSDLSHSVNTWWETAASGGNKDKEAIYWYAHAPDIARTVRDGAITAGTNILNCVSNNPFVAGDVGARIVVSGAGASGANLVTTIATFNSASQVVLAANAGTTVANAKVRFRLQKLGRENSKTSAAAVNDAVKDSSHSNYSTNLLSPDWVRQTGIIRMGSRNTLSAFFGYFGYPGGTAWTPSNPLTPDRTLYVMMNFARASAAVKFRGKFFFGIWNNADSSLEFLPSTNNFNLSVTTIGAPAATVAAQYLVVADTDRGYSFVSNVFSVPASPDETSFNQAVYNSLFFNQMPGAQRYRIYRKLGAGNVFLLESVNNAPYPDFNFVGRIDTGSTAFPVITEASDAVRTLVGTLDGDLDNVRVNGTGVWDTLALAIPFDGTIDFSNLGDLVLRIFLTEACSTLVSGSSNSSNTVTAASAVFVPAADFAGKPVVVRDNANQANIFNGTVSNVISGTQLQLSGTVPFSSSDVSIEVLDSQPHGVLCDLFGASFVPGVWARHSEDNAETRGQNVTTNPTGSTQGGTGTGGQPTTPGGGSISCTDADSLVSIFVSPGRIEKIKARDVQPGMRAFYGNQFRGNLIVSVKKHLTDQILEVETSSGAIRRCTVTHRKITAWDKRRTGVAMGNLQVKDKFLRFVENQFIFETIERITLIRGDFQVVEFGLDTRGFYDDGEQHLLIISDDLDHNQKPSPNLDNTN